MWGVLKYKKKKVKHNMQNYTVINQVFDPDCLRLFESMESGMEFIKNSLIHKEIMFDGDFGTGGYVMLDSADDGDKISFPYYRFYFVENGYESGYYEIFKLIPNSTVEL